MIQAGTGLGTPGGGDCQYHRHPYPCCHRRSSPGAIDETRLAVRCGAAGVLAGRNRLSIVAHRYGIKRAKGGDSLGKLFAAYLRRAEESVLGSVLVETTILYMSTRHNAVQVLHDPATAYKVDTEAITLKVKTGICH
jgi:hypothetical protein